MGVVLLAPREACVRQEDGGDIRGTSALERPRSRDVADYRGDARLDPPLLARVEDRLEIGTRPRCEHAEAHHARKTTSGSAPPLSSSPMLRSSTTPISQACSPWRPSSAWAPSTSSCRTTAHMPIPQLKVR